jgi:succinate-semialdehyde dehydrogenase/glutarate-semialdehyde dehydrogenase
MNFQSINPFTEELFGEYPFISNQELEQKLQNSYKAFLSWRFTTLQERIARINKAANYLEANKEAFARVMTLEMGKPVAQSIAEVEKSAKLCRYYADNLNGLLGSKAYKTDYKKAYVSYEPQGIIYAIMPWNYPLWQVLRCVVPAIMAGNAAVLKHAENVPQCALIIEKVFLECGFPENVFTNLFISLEQSDMVIDFEGVKGVSLTGSERAGSHVAARAGKNIKHSVLELGGSDPFIVLPDADIKKAVSDGVIARMQNSGQSCIAGKRFILHEAIADDFLEDYITQVQALKIGDPMLESTYVGPMARKDLREALEKQLSDSIKAGAQILNAKREIPAKGYFMQPLVLGNISKQAPAYSQELFGPVASMYIVKTEEEAIQLANDTSFGLGASIWTADEEKAVHLSKYLESGSVYINTIVKSDPRIPFGGVKHSGFGREMSDAGIHEFVNYKTICIA